MVFTAVARGEQNFLVTLYLLASFQSGCLVDRECRSIQKRATRYWCLYAIDSIAASDSAICNEVVLKAPIMSFVAILWGVFDIFLVLLVIAGAHTTDA
jgi:hypothetical protein